MKNITLVKCIHAFRKAIFSCRFSDKSSVFGEGKKYIAKLWALN